MTMCARAREKERGLVTTVIGVRKDGSLRISANADEYMS